MSYVTYIRDYWKTNKKKILKDILFCCSILAVGTDVLVCRIPISISNLMLGYLLFAQAVIVAITIATPTVLFILKK